MCSVEKAAALELLKEMDNMVLEDNEIDVTLDVFEGDKDKQEVFML